MHPFLFGIILLILSLLMLAATVAAIKVAYQSFWHVVGVIQRKERLHFDFHLFMIICCFSILSVILFIWPLAMYHLWISSYS